MNTNSYTLNKKQEHALYLFQNKYNIFVTGSAGTGKSYLIQQIILDYLKKGGEKEDIVVTSTTGISSLNIGGRTIHSWSGLQPSTDLTDINAFVLYIRKNNSLLNNWLYTKVLIIDEISMLSNSILDFLENVARKIRGIDTKFGGIQLVITGDFYQLPPVTEELESFAFQSKCWKDLIDYTIILKTIHRQNENNLIQFLNYIREGEVNSFVRQELEKYRHNNNYNQDYTHLYANKVDVARHNLKKLNQLDGDTQTFKATIIKRNKKIEGDISFPKDNCIVETLQLKPNSFIILNKTIDFKKGLVNGQQGKYLGNSNDQLLIETKNGRHYIPKSIWEFKHYDIQQYPVCLAWAITIHKSQGMGISQLSVNIGQKIFNDGQVYVALSRACDAKHLHISEYSELSIKCHPIVKKFYDKLNKNSSKWYLISNENEIYYKNKLNGLIKHKKPKNSIIIKDKNNNGDNIDNRDNSDNSDNSDNIDNGMDKDKDNDKDNDKDKDKDKDKKKGWWGVKGRGLELCVLCNKNNYRQDYFEFLDEKICDVCITSNRDYRLLTKTEIFLEFGDTLSKTKLTELLKGLFYKPQLNTMNPRFSASRLYLVKHVKCNIRLIKIRPKPPNQPNKNKNMIRPIPTITITKKTLPIDNTNKNIIKNETTNINSQQMDTNNQQMDTNNQQMDTSNPLCEPCGEVINIRKANLNKLGYSNLMDWLRDPNHLYIGRNMTVYVPGALHSKWNNPFSIKKYGLEDSLNYYKSWVTTGINPVTGKKKGSSPLINDIEELRGKSLGCWCHPEPCHGNILLDLLNSKIVK